MQRWGWNMSQLLAIHCGPGEAALLGSHSGGFWDQDCVPIPELIICGFRGCSSRGFMCWWFYERACVPKRLLSQWLESTSGGGSRGQHQQQWSLWVHTPGGRWHHRIRRPGGHLLGKNTHSGSFPSENALVLPTSQCSLEPDLGASTPTVGEQTLTPTGLWQPQSREEALPNIQRRLWSPQHQTHPLSRGQGPAHTEERCGKNPYQKQPSHQKYWTQAGYTGTVQHKKQPFKIMVDSCFS